MIQDSLAFDPWGQRRDPEDWQSLSLTALQANWFLSSKPTTQRGFTGHEMVDEMGLIHMNGRIYDPLLGRFLQADPTVQDPTQAVSLNRYAYAWNNPLNGTDPSGYSLKSLWDEVRPFVGAIVGVALIYFTGGIGVSLFATSWYGAALGGAIAGAAGAAANGTNILKGALTGGVTAAAFYGVGSAFSQEYCVSCYSGDKLKSLAQAAKIASHGVTGGLMSVLQKGKFGHGFAAASFTQAFARSIDGIKGDQYSALRVVIAATIGGTASVLSGGKFANGAVTSAFSRLFNDEMHKQEENSYIFGDQDASDEKVVSLIQDALTTSEGDTFGAWKSLYDRRFEVDNRDPTNINLAAAEHYMFARDFSKENWFGGASMAVAVPIKTAWKYVRPLFGIPNNNSRPSVFEMRWGNQGANDGTFDRGFPDLFGQRCASCRGR